MIESKINSIVIRKAPNEIPKKLFSYNYSRKAFFGTERWKKGVCPKKIAIANNCRTKETLPVQELRTIAIA